MSGNKTPRTPLEFLVQESNRLLEDITSGGGGGSSQGATSVVTSVSASVTSVELLASESTRIEAIIENDSTSDLYIKYGTGASVTSYTKKLLQGDAIVINTYTGVVSGIWISATGFARITQITF